MIVNSSQRNNYRNSFASILLFSGVQIYQIIIRIVKSKFVAILIGPAGMGIQALLHSTTDTISALTNLGLKTSSVKNIAAANRDGNSEIIAKTIISLRRLIWITGLIGLLICAIFSPIWSKTSFGSNEYVLAFIVVSVVILLDQLNNGELALLQGLQKKKMLARANLIGQTINAAVTIPLFYFWGIKAIVAALVLGSFITLVVSKIFTHKLNVPKLKMTWGETFSIGRDMVKLGFFLSLQYLMSTLVVWVVRNYVSNIGGVDEVGLYSAGTTIVSSYIGLVFAAIATDYYPRLASTNNTREMSDMVHTQAELTLLLFAPLVIAFIIFGKPIIVLLYSSKFLPIEHMMCWAICAVMLQAFGWAIAYTLLAKAKPIYFFINELFTTIWSLPIKLLCYKYWGLTGFGAATMLTFGLYLVQVLIVTKKLFNLSLNMNLWRLFFVLCLPVYLVFAIKLFLSDIHCYVFGSLALVMVSLFVIYRLNRIMDIKSYLKAKFKSRIPHGK